MVQIGLGSKGGIQPQARFRGISPVINLWIVPQPLPIGLLRPAGDLRLGVDPGSVL